MSISNYVMGVHKFESKNTNDV
ncbi:hypothetical protein PT2222_140029 [Paraburkholderia tropica]